MEEKVGFVYILTNPSFPEYVKIGYADDVDKRLQQLNNKECIPFSFRVYATYEVKKRLADKIIHKIIDGLNADLRVKEVINGKTRIREFYEMSPEKVYELLYDLADFADNLQALKKYKLNAEDVKAVKEAENAKRHYERNRKKLTFTEYGIPIGSELIYTKDNSIKCKVISETKVEFEGKEYSLSGLAGELNVRRGSKNRFICGTDVFAYNGEILSIELRKRLGL